MKTSSDVVSLIQARLAEISEATCHRRLTQFAEGRLIYMYLAGSYAEDIVQCAKERILLGMETEEGRKPLPKDLIDAEAFEGYVHGIINSLIDAESRHEKLLPLEDVEYQLSSTSAPAKEAELSDLKHELFSRLRRRAPRRLLPTIEGWERVFLQSDRIPAVNGHRKYVGEVKQMAQKVVLEISDMN